MLTSCASCSAKAQTQNARDNFDLSALYLAAGRDKADIVRILADKGADVNAKEINDGTTALMHAALVWHADVVRVLLDKGANVNAKDNGGSTAFDGGC